MTYGVRVKAARRGALALVSAALMLSGCANPGPPKPPSLNLPRLATSMHAERWGAQVRLSWIVPTTTTDGLLLPGAQASSTFHTKRHAHMGTLAAEVCREFDASSGCKPVTRMPVKAGEHATWEDTLTAQQTQGEPHVVRYRVRIMNASGRSAGLSEAAAIATGPAPEAVHGLAIKATRRGASLSWTRSATSAKGETAYILREEVQARPSEDNAEQHADHTELTVPASHDPGGAMDIGARAGKQYRYTVYRTRRVVADGASLEVRGTAESVTSPLLTDTFAPPAPKDLVAIATPADATHKPAIDISWEPLMESDLAGYNVYRMEEGGAWSRRTSAPVAASAYHDDAVLVGLAYRYRVTAVDHAGNESVPSDVAVETVPETPK